MIRGPRADLLTRPVPAHELAALGFEQEIDAARLQPGAEGGITLRQDVEHMAFDPATGVRSIALRYRLKAGGRVLWDERAALRYAAVPAAELDDLARRSGARVVAVRAGFRDGVDSECVVEIEKP